MLAERLIDAWSHLFLQYYQGRYAGLRTVSARYIRLFASPVGSLTGSAYVCSVLTKMSFSAADHIYLCTVLPTLPSSSSSILSNPFSSSSSTPSSSTPLGPAPTSHGSSIEHGSDYRTPAEDESKQDRDLRVFKEIRGSAMDRLAGEAAKLKEKGCSITPVIVHVRNSHLSISAIALPPPLPPSLTTTLPRSTFA